MIDEKPKKQDFKFTATKEDNAKLLVDIIAKNTNLSKSLIKRLMLNGSVFQTYKGKRKNARKAKNTLKEGDIIECYYDPNINQDLEFRFNVIFETTHYGIYHKPPGAMTEGTKYGDRGSLLRHIEKKKRFAYLVNRLDREIEGLVVVAYDSKTQNLLQEMWREKVLKRYQAIVLGELPIVGTFEQKINNKFSKTSFECIKTEGNHSYVELELATERKHQVRIHFSDNGTPVLGDPIFGQNNKNRNGLMLISYCLEFTDPITKKLITAELPERRMLF